MSNSKNIQIKKFKPARENSTGTEQENISFNIVLENFDLQRSDISEFKIFNKEKTGDVLVKNILDDIDTTISEDFSVNVPITPNKKYRFKVILRYNDESEAQEVPEFVDSFVFLQDIKYIELQNLNEFLKNYSEFGKKTPIYNGKIVPIYDTDNTAKLAIPIEAAKEFVLQKNFLNPSALYNVNLVNPVFGDLNIEPALIIQNGSERYYLGASILEKLENNE